MTQVRGVLSKVRIHKGCNFLFARLLTCPEESHMRRCELSHGEALSWQEQSKVSSHSQRRTVSLSPMAHEKLSPANDLVSELEVDPSQLSLQMRLQPQLTL